MHGTTNPKLKRASDSYSGQNKPTSQLAIYFFQINFIFTFPIHACAFEVG